MAPPAAIAINVALLSAFALHHSLFARTGAKAWLARVLPHGFERSLYVWLASLLFLAVCLAWQPLPGVAWQAPGFVRWGLHGLQLGGLVLTLRSASRIDIWELAGVRQARAALGAPRSRRHRRAQRLPHLRRRWRSAARTAGSATRSISGGSCSSSACRR